MITPEWHWFLIDVNPEPWAVGPVGSGRKNGKLYSYVGRNDQLWHFQQAVKEDLGKPGIYFEGKMELQFYFWRRRDEYQTYQARGHRKHEADLTNLQKATEDALQEILFKNDKDSNDIHSVMVAQGPDVIGKIVVAIRQGVDNPKVIFPVEITEKLEDMESWEEDSDFAKVPELEYEDEDVF